MSIEHLCSFISYFENIDPDKACHWPSRDKSEDGRIILHPPVYERQMLDFKNAFIESGLMVEDYQNVLDRRLPNWRTVNINKVVETADFELLKTILTKCIRVERFCDGAWDDFIRDGLFLAILRRLSELITDTPSESPFYET